MKIELTEEQIQILYKLIVQSNWNGQHLEIAKELKDKLGKAVEEIVKENNE